ncbi:proline dehydrogenase family protein [Microvirga sp. STR05]|uniref:Proline dehydrogenase family protein n=1 Tax=Hymenobacter duratus TaxID=2771356 RepID=A0ABR8JLI3_9BACT|nr:proline dehydrogenase family protein [Hymenobacter duratus]MBD2715649.1 proline dehydrogenase family protein [Hymenobacter duratus]MBR7950557.1 proline dehydrogenase family protein [Microvirga sp. STR05]
MPTTQAPPISFDDTAVAFASKSDAELRKMYALFAAMNNNVLVKTGGGLMKTALKWQLPGTKFLIKKSIFNQFCGGETIQECIPVIGELGRYQIGTILDYSVEGEGSDKSFDHTCDEILATIDLAHRSTHIPFSVFKVTGLADSALLEKVQAGKPLTAAEQTSYERAHARVDAICQRAHQYGVRVFVDAEESWFQETIDNLAYEMMRKYNRESAIVWNTYQLYRQDRLEAIKEAYADAKKDGYFLGGKLVRGAYMEKEARVAAQRGYPNPINPSKQATDDLYDEALRYCVSHVERISICAGTHNEASSRLLTELMQEYDLQPGDSRIWFAQLYGMSDNLSYNLAHAGYNTAKYVPYGPVDAVMPYLLRRADENTAIAGQSSREFLLIQKEIRRRQNR